MFDGDALRQIFSITGAAWTSTAILFLLAVRMWNGAPAMLEQWIAYRKAKAEEKAASHGRLLDEINRLSSQLAVKTEECDMVRDRWADEVRISNERLGRAVIAEAGNVARDKELGRASILPGTTERKPSDGNGK